MHFVRKLAPPVPWLPWLLAAWLGPVAAQDMEPRSYSPAPVGLNFIGATYQESRGGVAVDPSLPLDNVNAAINTVAVGFARTFPLAGRTASFAVAQPFAWGDISGDVREDRRTVSRQGFADTRLRLAINLRGGPARTPAEFAAREPGSQLGLSFSLVAPSGEYNSTRLINLGSNRWAFKPEIGWYQPIGRWGIEIAGGVWVYADNKDFFGGSRRQQDPLGTTLINVSYTFRPGLWLASSATWYGGGDTSIDGQAKRDRQSNTRIGATLSIPVTAGHSLKISWADGVTTRIGSDFSTVSVSWQYAWQSPP